jgi:glycosyltransferase involved in cell wall biosynthesis
MDKLEKISVITPCYKDVDTLPLHIETFLDQDYTEKELVLIDDGSQDGTKEVIQKYAKKYPKVIKAIYFSKNKGACTARNEGAKIATGDVYSFLPADSFLKPGMLRYWMEALEKHPEHGFLYGGYTFVDTSSDKPTWLGGQVAQVYLSQPFDARELETANYIDGSFPIRKEVFWDAAEKVGLKNGLWNDEVKSLQDWDFWLSVVKDLGVTGHYVNSSFFETTLPHAGGLSYDSHKNWAARVRQIRALHKIPMRPFCVSSLGAPFHGQSIAKLLDADFLTFPQTKGHEYKGIYMIGFFPTAFADHASVFIKPEHFQKLSQMMSKGESPEYYGGIKLIHWIGSDVLGLKSLSMEQLKVVREFCQRCDGVFAELPEIQKELKAFGIDSEVVPFPPRKWYEVEELPKKKAVAVYMPRINEDFYFKKLFLGHDGKGGVARKMKDIDFYFFGNDKEVGPIGKNIHLLGTINGVGDVIKRTNAIVRITQHDGLPISVAEWIGAGRNALTTVKMPFADHFDLGGFVKKYGEAFTLGDLEKELEKAIRVVVEKPLNSDGAKHYYKWLDADKYKKKIYSYLEYDEKRYWERRAWSWKKEAHEEFPQVKKFQSLFKMIKAKTVLDVGCGEGRWSKWLQNGGYEYEGCDISEHLVETSKKLYPMFNFFQSSVEDLDKKAKKKYDLLFLYTVLQHIPPKNFAKAVTALKKVGKYMILIEPREVEDKNYCFHHNYSKEFNVIKRVKVDPWRDAWLIDLSKNP